MSCCPPLGTTDVQEAPSYVMTLRPPLVAAQKVVDGHETDANP
jgi:hypothetical protein